MPFCLVELDVCRTAGVYRGGLELREAARQMDVALGLTTVDLTTRSLGRHGSDIVRSAPVAIFVEWWLNVGTTVVDVADVAEFGFERNVVGRWIADADSQTHKLTNG